MENILKFGEQIWNLENILKCRKFGSLKKIWEFGKQIRNSKKFGNSGKIWNFGKHLKILRKYGKKSEIGLEIDFWSEYH